VATHGLRVLGVLVLVAPLSCGGMSSGGGGGRGGGAGSGGGGGAAQVSDGLSIGWNDQGVISSDTNEFGIQGTWFFETDCADAAPEGLPCTVPDATLVGPDGQLGWSTSADRVCAKGVGSQVIEDPETGMPAYSLQWGVRIGFALNEDPRTGDRGPYDAAMRGLSGFQFDVASPNATPYTLRVVYLATTLPAKGFWGTTGWPMVEFLLPTVDLVAPFEQRCEDCPGPIDTTVLTEVHFEMFTNPNAPKPFDFCISDLRVALE